MTEKCFKKEETEIADLLICSSADWGSKNIDKAIVYALLLIARCINEKEESHTDASTSTPCE